jgi:hypothetical protein
MTLGFTGTSRGMMQRQRATVRYLFGELELTDLHHGDCVGADAQADEDAIHYLSAVNIVVHPPTVSTKRAFRQPRAWRLVLDPKPYLKRNRDIVAAGIDGLIAAPKDSVEPRNKRGQGTWTTIGYARQAGRRIWIVFPDGTFREEPAR